jgi:predicted dehydrogenase
MTDPIRPPLADPNAPVRAAVVGAGHLGSAHARVYSELPQADLVAVCDIDAARAEEVARRHRTRAVTDYHDLLGLPGADPDLALDAASIAVPTSLHYEVARAFIERGIPVLVEKPFTTTLAQAQVLVDLGRERQAIIQVGHIERFNPAFAALDRLGVWPRYIEADRLSPFRFRSADIGVVLDLMIHDLDIVRYLARSPLTRVDAVGVNVIGKHEDVANARLVFANGCVANITASRVATKSMRRIRLFARDCYVGIDTGEFRGLLIKKSPDFPIDGLDLTNFDASRIPDLTEYFLKDLLHIEELHIDAKEPLAAELGHFIECVRTGRQPAVPAEQGAAALELATQVLESIRSHPWTDDLGRPRTGPPGPGPISAPG